MSLPAIGFVGVGRMGANMARRLKEVGYTIVAVYDARPETSAGVATELEAKAAERVSEVSQLAEVIFTIVTDDAAMRSIYFGQDNLFEHARGKYFVNCATASPAVHVEVEAAGAERGSHVLEAPLASSIPQAREGKLYMMLAGDPRAEAKSNNSQCLIISLLFSGKYPVKCRDISVSMANRQSTFFLQ